MVGNGVARQEGGCASGGDPTDYFATICSVTSYAAKGAAVSSFPPIVLAEGKSFAGTNRGEPAWRLRAGA